MIRNRKIIVGGVIGITLIAIICIWYISQPQSYRLVKVMETYGTVELDRDGITDIPVTSAMNLENNDRVEVGTASYVRMSLDKDKYIYAEEETTFEILAEGTDQNSKSVIKLTKGAITTEIQEPLQSNSTFEIETPNSVMAVRGTVYRVEAIVGNDGETYTMVSVFEGEVQTQLIAPDGTISDPVQIPAGKGVAVRGDEILSEYVVADLDEDGKIIPETVRSADAAVDQVVFDLNLQQLSVQTLESLQTILTNGVKEVGSTFEELAKVIEEKKAKQEEAQPSESETKLEIENTDTEERLENDEVETVESNTNPTVVIQSQEQVTTPSTNNSQVATTPSVTPDSNAEEPNTEEPDTEEPDTEEPDTEEPDTEEPDTEEPDTEEPDTEEPDTEEPQDVNYLVTYVYSNGKENSINEVKEGASVTLPVDVTYSGYTFEGWYLDKECVNKAEETYTVNNNLTFYAKWEVSKVTYTVTYVYGLGMENVVETVEQGTVVNIPTKLKKDGYTFAGWYLEQEYQTLKYGEMTPETDMILYAKWDKLVTLKLEHYFGDSTETPLTKFVKNNEIAVIEKSVTSNSEVNITNLATEIEGYKYWKYVVVGNSDSDSANSYHVGTEDVNINLYYVKSEVEDTNQDSGSTTNTDVIYYSDIDIENATQLYVAEKVVKAEDIKANTYAALTLEDIKGKYQESTNKTWDTSGRVFDRWYGLTGLKYAGTGTEYNILDGGPYILYPKWKTTEVHFWFIKGLNDWPKSSYAECYVGDSLTSAEIKTLFPNITEGYSVVDGWGDVSNGAIGPIAESGDTYIVWLLKD